MPDRSITAFAPGRVNLIGEHTDYNSGLALPFAISRGITVTVQPTSDPAIEVQARDLGESDTFTLAQIEPAAGWRGYVRGMVAEIWGPLTGAAAGAHGTPQLVTTGHLPRAEQVAPGGHLPAGAQISIWGDLPRGGGLGSSAALTVALGLALTAAAGLPELDRFTLAQTCQQVEHDWAHAQTGLLDPLASLAGEAGSAVLIDFQELALIPTPLELQGHTLVLLDTGERHTHTSSSYNERRALCEEAAHRMRVETLRDASIADLHMLPDELVGLARHVISEIGRVLHAVDALQHGNFEKLGRLLSQSHVSLRDDFQVSTPALDAAAQQLIAAGALGARMIGGGFGGSVLGLMPPGGALPPGAEAVSPCDGARLIA